MLARIEFDGAPAPDFVDINENNLVAAVSNPEVRVFGKGNSIRVLAVDCGMKHNIVRELARRGAEVRYMLSLSNIHPLHLMHLCTYPSVVLPGDRCSVGLQVQRCDI